MAPPLSILQAMAAAHADDEFQSDAAQPHVRAAVEVLRQDPAKYDQYAGGWPAGFPCPFALSSCCNGGGG